jgi:glycosyltransferase involved in cell wall biosynthesis
MRIAWIGPNPSTNGGVAYVATQLLRELVRAGAEVDCYLSIEPEQLPDTLRPEESLGLVLRPSRWRWNRWYSRTPFLAFLSGTLARLHTQHALARTIAKRHAERPYDVVYQFSQSELGGLRRLRAVLPPIVVHPETHAAGELAWFRREAALARRSEPPSRRALARAMLTIRAAVQRRDVPRADRVLGVSRRFADHLAADYRIAADRLGVVANPIDLDRFHPRNRRPANGPVVLLFVSRISVRKGVDLVVGLSHRLADLEGQVKILIVGGPTLWSDYRKLLSDLNPAIATYAGELGAAELADLYKEAAAVLQPSQYEPFALTVGEALASGTPVVVSDEVGAAEDVDRRVCSVFAHGDLEAFERAVRDVIAGVRSADRSELSALARAEAERLFAPPVVGAKLLAELERARRGRAAPDNPGAGAVTPNGGLNPLS